MASYNPANPGCTFSRFLNGRCISHVKEKNAGKLLVLEINITGKNYSLICIGYSRICSDIWHKYHE